MAWTCVRAALRGRYALLGQADSQVDKHVSRLEAAGKRVTKFSIVCSRSAWADSRWDTPSAGVSATRQIRTDGQSQC